MGPIRGIQANRMAAARFKDELDEILRGSCDHVRCIAGAVPPSQAAFGGRNRMSPCHEGRLASLLPRDPCV